MSPLRFTYHFSLFACRVYNRQGHARYQCSTHALALNMQIILEPWLTYLLPMYTVMRVEKTEDILSIKSLHVWSRTLIFGMPVAMDGKANQQWEISWDPGDCMFVLDSCEECWTTSELTPQHCSNQIKWSSLVLACAS